MQLSGRFAGILGSEYEKLLRSMPYYFWIQNKIAQLARGTRGEIRTILDLGCGSGMTTLALCQHLRNFSIVGVDEQESEMLTKYRAKIKTHERDLAASSITVKALHSDALTFLRKQKDSSFDVVVSGFMLHNLTIALRAKILKEIARVLRPGGRFVNGDKIAPNSKGLHNTYLLQQLTKFISTYTAPEDLAYCVGWIEHYVQDNQIGIRYLESEVRSSLKVAGFRKIRIVGRHCMEAVAVADRL